MRSTTKTVLYVRTKDGSKPAQHPVAVFPSEDAAGDFAKAMFTAAKNGDADTLKLLFPAMPVGADEKPLTIDRYIRVEMPYSPSPFVSADDPFADDKSDAK